MTRAKSPEERFWPRVKRGDGCWEWQGQRDMKGYAVINIRRAVGRHVPMGAHRLSWQLAYGDIPPGLEVCHRCDNPLCVRPDHLFLGTHRENMADMRAKGRQSNGDGCCRGERHGMSKLTEANVREILVSAERGTALAARFGVTPTMVCAIRRRRSWRHITCA